MKLCDKPSKIVKAGTILWCCQYHAEESAQRKNAEDKKKLSKSDDL